MEFILPWGLPALLLYLGAAGLLIRQLLQREHTERPPFVALGAGFAAVILHAVLLYQAIATPTGLDLGFFRVASLWLWLASVLVLLATLRRPVQNLGIGIFPLATISIALLGLAPGHAEPIRGAGPGLEWHILLSLFAYSVLALAAVQSILLYLQHRQLHNKRPVGAIRALPPLQTMEGLLFELIGLGFVLLTGALASGFIALEDMFAQHLVHKTVLSIVAWVVFGTLLWARRRFGWRGRVAIRWALSGFAVSMLAYFGSKLVLEFILGR